jgi:hypothetical protein
MIPSQCHCHDASCTTRTRCTAPTMPPARRPAAARPSRKRKDPVRNATSEASPEPGGGQSDEPSPATAIAAAAAAAAAGVSKLALAQGLQWHAGSRTVLSPPLAGGKRAHLLLQPKRARVEFDAESYAAAMEMVKAGEQMRLNRGARSTHAATAPH